MRAAYICEYLMLGRDEATCATRNVKAMTCRVVLILFGILLSKRSLETGAAQA